MYRYKEPGKKFPTNTVHQMRIPIFLPIEQVRNRDTDNYRKWVYSSQFGSVTVRNYRLTQNHRNLIDTIFTNYRPVRLYDDDSVEFAFTLYDLQKCMGKKSFRNHSWIKRKFDELVDSTLVVEPQKDYFKKVTFSILNEHSIHREMYGKTGKGIYSVIFNRHYLRFFDIDMNVYTGLLTKRIINLGVPGAQALTRYCLSHETVNMRFSKVMICVGLSKEMLPSATVSRVKARVLQCRNSLKKNFGIFLDPDVRGYSEKDPLVKYHKNSAVKFRNPVKN